MKHIHQTLLTEKELYHAIVEYVQTHGIPDAKIDGIEILCDGGVNTERVMPASSSDIVRISYETRK